MFLIPLGNTKQELAKCVAWRGTPSFKLNAELGRPEGGPERDPEGRGGLKNWAFFKMYIGPMVSL